ncbi:MAG: hypothetical protein Q7V19_05305, partial [Bacteroidales bacterium]|nr:hypothetical protein [Bacteroidales bacterium]
MKKLLLFLIIILTVLYFFVKPVRTKKVLLNIAQNEFASILMYDSIRNQLNGPASLDRDDFVEFKWYKVLEWDDTAAIYIDVFKHPTSLSWRDNFFWPRVTMNYQWSYLASG